MKPLQMVGLAWIVFGLYWLVSAFATNRTVQREGSAGVARRIFLGFVAWYLFFVVWKRDSGFLSARFIPRDSWIAWLGAAMTVAGVAFAIWARIHIGRYWSGNVVLKQGHQLIRTGPYSRIRHPIYAGMLFGLTGTALALGFVGGLLVLAIYTTMFWFKARKEEALLTRQFGPAFEQHRRRTGFFLPRLDLPSHPRNTTTSTPS